MVPESVDDRVLEEHMLRDRFYNLDYTSISSSAASSAARSSQSLHAKLGYAYDVLLFTAVLVLAAAVFFVALKALAAVRRSRRRDSPLLPTTISPALHSVASFPNSASSSPTLSTISTFSASSLKDRVSGKPSGVFDRLFSLVHGDDRYRQD